MSSTRAPPHCLATLASPPQTDDHIRVGKRTHLKISIIILKKSAMRQVEHIYSIPPESPHPRNQRSKHFGRVPGAAKHFPISGDLPASAAPTARRPSWIRRPSPPWVPPAITGPRLQKRVLMPALNFIVHAQKEVPIPAFSFYTKREMPRTTGMGFCVAQCELASSGCRQYEEEAAVSWRAYSYM
ncbi:hypothetical protein B0H10DRAFT_1950083 [Mycena sp. CBHHK59/15]|nr:hypothetical protein B0H10DRAFT_1950083 [Mycena sp. CBHHK59/15]